MSDDKITQALERIELKISHLNKEISIIRNMTIYIFGGVIGLAIAVMPSEKQNELLFLGAIAIIGYLLFKIAEWFFSKLKESWQEVILFGFFNVFIYTIGLAIIAGLAWLCWIIYQWIMPIISPYLT